MAVRRLVSALAVLGLAVSFPATARAADTQAGVAFASDGDLKAGTPGAEARVCNTTAAPLDVTLLVEPSSAPVRLPDPQPIHVGPGSCAPFTVTGAPGDTAATATLVATAPGAGLARRTVKVDAKSIAGNITGAFESFNLKGHFDGGIDGPVKLDNRVLVFSVDGPYTQPETGAVIGRVAHGRDIALVRVTGVGEALGKDGYWLPVEVTGADGQGVFKGKLTLLADKDGKAPDITVTVADDWRMFALVVLLGLFAGFVAKLLAGKYLPIWRLSWHQRRLLNAYGRVGGEAHCGYLPPDQAKVAAFVQQNRAELDAYRKTTVVFDAAAAAYKKVRENLAAAERDAKLLEDDGLCPAIDDLKAELAAFKKDFTATFPQADFPKAAADAAAIAKPHKDTRLDVGQASALSDKAAALGSFLSQWGDLAEEFRSCRRRLIAHRDPPEDMVEFRDQALVWLGEVEAALRDVGDTLKLDKVAVVAGLRRIHGVLVLLDQADASGRNVLGDDDAADDGAEAVAEARKLVASALGDALPAGLFGALGEVGLIGVGLLGELFVLALSAGLAWLVAAKALYSGQAWGTAWDYLAAFGAGAGAEALLSGGLTAFNSWRSIAPAGAAST
jgi:hypothetical protein